MKKAVSIKFTAFIFCTIVIFFFITSPILPLNNSVNFSTIRAEEIQYTMSMSAGWSMISLPVAPNNVSASTLFPEAVVIYGYERGRGYVRIQNGEELEVGKGYWIYFNEEESYTLTGQFIQEYDLLISENGWCMIGGCSSPSKANINEGILWVIYRYVPQFGYKRVHESENLEQGRGYWISLTGVSSLDVRTISPTIEWTFHKTPDNAHPDEKEQQMVWLMNRARANPTEEGIWLATTNILDIVSARNYFNVDVNILENEFAGYSVKPPAAFDVRLYYAAKEHSEDLISRDAQDHNQQFDRVISQGFSFTSARGNVFAYGKNALHAHAAFNIDWGSGFEDGMLPGRGHRKAIMSIDGEYTNVGIAMLSDSDPNTNVGPLVITGNYCNALSSAENHYNRFLLGTVWEDGNGNSVYDPGEGIPEVTVIPDHGEYHAITSNSGGYAIPITAPDTYLVTFSGPFLKGNVFRIIDIGSDSVSLDLIIDSAID